MAEIVPVNAAKTEEKPTVSVESQESQSTAKMVKEFMRRSNEATKDLRAKWPDNYQFVVSGVQWPMRRPRYRFSEVVNITWSNIMTEVGLQTDSRPVVEYNAVEPSDFQFAQILKKINDVNWNKSLVTGHGWQRKTSTGVFKSKLYHVVHAEVAWDQELEQGLGDVDFKILDPYGCFWDPTADSIHECRWFVYSEPCPTAQLKKEHPKHADKIKPDLTMMDKGSIDGIDDTNIDLFWATTVLAAFTGTISAMLSSTPVPPI